MSLFSSHEALYFVFAGEHDHYYLNSMLRLNTYTYLWMELRESNYETVYFIGSLNQAYTVKAIDDVSKKQYNASCGGLFSKRTAIPPEENSTQAEAEPLRKWIDDYFVKGTGKSVALVFSPEAFARLYTGNAAKKQFNKLIERGHNGNSVLLRFPMSLREEDHRLLIDPNGIFAYRTPTGASVCPELSALLSGGQTVELLSRLKTHIGGRLVELGAVTIERLRSLMRCVRFQRGADWSEDQLLEYANCLYSWWYLSENPEKFPPGFRRMWGKLFRELRQRGDLYAALYGKLCDGGEWKSFQDRVGLLGDDRNNFLFPSNRTQTEEKCRVMLADTTLSNIAHIPWPEELRQELVQTPSLHIPSREDWRFMQASLPAPTNKPVPQDRLRSMDEYYRHFQLAEERRDWATLCRAVNAMLYGGTHLYEGLEEADYFRMYETYLEYSRYYFQQIRNSSAGATGSVADDFRLAQLATIKSYSEFLTVADARLSGGMHLLKKPDIRALEELMKALKDPAEPGTQEEKTLFTDDIELSPEEADALLRKRAET